MDIWDIETNENTQDSNKKIEVKEISLSGVQKELIVNRWRDETKNPPSILELLKIAFPSEPLDGRSKQASLIKELLVEMGVDSKESFYKEKKNFQLKPEHQEYIKNNY